MGLKTDQKKAGEENKGTFLETVSPYMLPNMPTNLGSM